MVRYDSDTDSFIPINFDEYTIQYTVEVSDKSIEKIADAVARKLANFTPVDAVRATMPWTDPDGTERMLDEVSYEIGYSQGQKDTKRQGHWVRFYGDHIHMGLRPKWDCCSECGMVRTPTRYCSNCGARMDGEE